MRRLGHRTEACESRKRQQLTVGAIKREMGCYRYKEHRRVDRERYLYEVDGGLF